MKEEMSRGSYRDLVRGARSARNRTSALRPEAHRQASEWIQRYGLAVGDKMIQAQDWLELDVRSLHKPPSGWAFVAVLIPAMDAPPGFQRPEYSEEQQRDAKAFWAWYGPLESNLIALCTLIVELRKVRDAAPEVVRQFEALLGVALELQAHYSDRCRTQEIAWLPKRLEWRKGRSVELCTIVQFLGRHLNEYSDRPPQWATEELPKQWEAAF